MQIEFKIRVDCSGVNVTQRIDCGSSGGFSIPQEATKEKGADIAQIGQSFPGQSSTPPSGGAPARSPDVPGGGDGTRTGVGGGDGTKTSVGGGGYGSGLVILLGPIVINCSPCSPSNVCEACDGKDAEKGSGDGDKTGTHGFTDDDEVPK
jgi:hypothetical protein